MGFVQDKSMKGDVEERFMFALFLPWFLSVPRILGIRFVAVDLFEFCTQGMIANEKDIDLARFYFRNQFAAIGACIESNIEDTRFYMLGKVGAGRQHKMEKFM